MQKLITVIHRHKSQNFATYSTELEFLKSLWGLGTEEELGYRTGPPEPILLNVYVDQALIPKNEFRHPM
jgi:hypothetical protein